MSTRRSCVSPTSASTTTCSRGGGGWPHRCANVLTLASSAHAASPLVPLHCRPNSVPPPPSHSAHRLPSHTPCTTFFHFSSRRRPPSCTKPRPPRSSGSRSSTLSFSSRLSSRGAGKSATRTFRATSARRRSSRAKAGSEARACGCGSTARRSGTARGRASCGLDERATPRDDELSMSSTSGGEITVRPLLSRSS